MGNKIKYLIILGLILVGSVIFNNFSNVFNEANILKNELIYLSNYKGAYTLINNDFTINCNEHQKNINQLLLPGKIDKTNIKSDINNDIDNYNKSLDIFTKKYDNISLCKEESMTYFAMDINDGKITFDMYSYEYPYPYENKNEYIGIYGDKFIFKKDIKNFIDDYNNIINYFNNIYLKYEKIEKYYYKQVFNIILIEVFILLLFSIIIGKYLKLWSGRIGRIEYIINIATIISIAMVLLFLFFEILDIFSISNSEYYYSSMHMFVSIFIIFYFLFLFVGIQRGHDCNIHGISTIIIFKILPIISHSLYIIRPGNKNINEYGNPKEYFTDSILNWLKKYIKNNYIFLKIQKYYLLMEKQKQEDLKIIEEIKKSGIEK